MKSIKPLIGAAAIVAALTSMASAQSILHRYDMSNVNDSIGSANGTLSAGATLSGGVLTPQDGANPSGGTGRGLVLPTTAVAGLNDSFSIETWYTWNGQGGYQTVFSFSNGTNENYLIDVANRGNHQGFQSSAFKFNNVETYVEGPANATNLLTQTVVTYDGISTARFYVNGTLANTITDINSSFDLSAFTQLGIGGSSPWGDDVLKGTISDFRIYSGVLSGSQISTLNGLGADATNGQIISAVPEPTTVALLVGAGVAGLVMRRRSRA